MESNTINTIVKMLEELPESLQNQVADHLREYITEMQDEIRWELLFKKTQSNLIAASKKAKREIAEGLAVEAIWYDKDIHKGFSIEEWKQIFSQLIEQIGLHTTAGGNSVEDIRRERERYNTPENWTTH